MSMRFPRTHTKLQYRSALNSIMARSQFNRKEIFQRISLEYVFLKLDTNYSYCIPPKYFLWT